MSTGKYGTEEIQKAVKQIDEIFEDVKKAREPESTGGKKITLGEAIGLIVQDAGKLVKIANAADSILDQIIDLDSTEAPKIIDAFKALYSPENPYIISASVKALEGGLKLKESAEDFAQAKKWEKEKV